jgi:hypothetical protein
LRRSVVVGLEQLLAKHLERLEGACTRLDLGAMLLRNKINTTSS